jgi:branched-chain amino acid transport system substrate-binding protein
MSGLREVDVVPTVRNARHGRGRTMRHQRLLATAAVVGAFALVASACAGEEASPGGGGTPADEFGSVQVAPGDPIKVGTLLVETTADKNLGLDSEYGVELAVDHLDGTFDQTDGQILGHPIALVKEDDKCDASGGQEGGTKLAADPQIVAVIGTSCSSAALGVADKILGDKGIPLISPSNTNPALTQEGVHNPFYLRTAHNDVIQAGVVSDFVIQRLNPQSAATIHDESPYTTALSELFADNMKKQGVEVTAIEAINSEQQDFKALLTKMGQQAPDVIYMPDFEPACGLIPKQAEDVQGLADTTFISSDGCANPETAELGGDAVNGMYRSGPDLTGFAQADFYNNEFLPAYTELSGENSPLSTFHAHAYDAFNILAEAIKKVAVQGDDGSLTIGRSALRDALFATSGYQGIVGTITCNPLGDCATDVAIAVYQIPNDPSVSAKAGAQPVFKETKTLADFGVGT